MRLSQIRQGAVLQIQRIPQGLLKQRLAQFGLVDGMSVQCRMARKHIVAIQWPGTVVAIRRSDIDQVVCRGMECEQ